MAVRQLLLDVDFNTLIAESTEAVVKAALQEPSEKVLQVQVKVFNLLKAQYNGMPLSKQARYASCDPSNLKKILNRGREYAESGKPGHEERAAKLFYEAWFKVGMEAAFDDIRYIRDSQDWKARAFLLKARFPEIYEKEKQGMIKNDNRVQVAVNVESMSAIQLKELICEQASRLDPGIAGDLKKALPEKTADWIFEKDTKDSNEEKVLVQAE